MATRRSYVYTAILALLLTAAFRVSQAQAVTLIPPSLEFSDIQPGAVIPSKVKIFNETATTLTLYSETATFGSLDEGGTPNIQVGGSQDGLATWIEVAPGPFTIEPGERLEVPFTITLPQDATPGGQYASILFSPQAPETSGQGQVAISQKIGTLILVTVAGTVNESGSIIEFGTTNGKTNFSRLPIDFHLRFQNSGNVHLRPKGDITIRNVLGGTSAVIPTNATLGATLPQSIRKYDVVWEKQEGSDVRGNFFQEIGREWQNFGLGPYTANVVLTYGQAKEKTVNSTFEFWIFPWRVLLVSLLVIVAVILLIIFFVKRYNHWIIAKAKDQTKNQ